MSEMSEFERLLSADQRARSDMGERGKRAIDATHKTQLALAQMGVTGDKLLETLSRGVAGSIRASGYIFGTSAEFDPAACAREVLDGPFGEFAQNARVAGEREKASGGKTRAELIAEGEKIKDPKTKMEFARKHGLY